MIRFVPILALALALALPAAAQSLSVTQREEVVRILREALVQDPSILRDAIAAMQAAEEMDAARAAQVALGASRDALERDPADPVAGNPRGDVTVVVFVDPRCGYCKQLHPTLHELLQKDRKLRLVVKDIPILGPNSVVAARALLAAHAQGKHQALLDAVMALRVEPTEAVLKAEAEKIGLDWARLRQDMDSPAVGERLGVNLALAQTLGVRGTPAIVIGDALIPGAVGLPELQAAVAAARKRG